MHALQILLRSSFKKQSDLAANYVALHGGILMSYSIPTARISRRSPKYLALLASGFVLLAGCVTTTQTASQINQLESIRENPRILLMPPDIKYFLLTAGGVTEPNREWTEAAQQNFSVALQEYAARIGTDLATIDTVAGVRDEEEKYRRLHAAVGMTLQQNHFGAKPLPSKQLPDNERRFDWSLGPGVSQIGEKYDADYLLFVFYRDYQASGGRVAFAILASAFNVGVSTGYEGGFASLVDLKTGDVVWFNSVAVGAGEMRDPNGARTAVERLFKDIPTS